MKNTKNELLQFVGGAVMLVVGLYILSQKVLVTSGFFGGVFYFGGFGVNSGLIMIPFIIGIVWMFTTDASFPSKVFTVLSVILIIASIIMNTNIRLMTITLYEWVLILVLIFGGAGFLAKVLFAGSSKDLKEDKKSTKNSGSSYSSSNSIDDEIERMKKGK